MTAPATLTLGDVIQDSYANPAVVVRIEMRGTRHQRYTIMQTCGSDRGRVTGAPSLLRAVTDPAQVEWARAVVREEAKRQGWKWDTDGITRSAR